MNSAYLLIHKHMRHFGAIVVCGILCLKKDYADNF